MCVIQLGRDFRIYNIVVLLLMCLWIQYVIVDPTYDLTSSNRHGAGGAGMIRFGNYRKKRK